MISRLLTAGGFLILPCMLSGASPFTDTILEGLLAKYRYSEAANLGLRKVGPGSPMETNTKLYYWNRISLAELKMRKLDSALLAARISLSLTGKATDSTQIAEAWRVAAYAFNNTGKLDTALYFTMKLLDYARRNREDKMARNALSSLATLLSQNKKFDEALKYNRESLTLTIKLKDSANLPVGLYNIGLTHLNLKNADSAIIYLNNAASLTRVMMSPDLLIYIYGTLADCYLFLGNQKERKKYLEMANAIAEKIGNRQFLAMGYCNLTEGALRENNYRDALEFGEKALENLEFSPYPVLQMKLDSMLSVAYSGVGNPAKALYYLQSFIKRKETITGEAQKAKLNELIVKYEVREKDLTIENQKLEIESRRRSIQLLVLVLVFVLISGGGLAFYNFRNKMFRNVLYEKEKEMDRHISVSSQSFLFNELRELFEKEKLYLQPDLNLETVIKALGTNKKYLYEAISTNTRDNFRSFLNRYRVNEAKRIIEEKTRKNEEIDIPMVYSSTGFNSQVSFYRAFKSVTGLTPREYEGEIRKEIRKSHLTSQKA